MINTKPTATKNPHVVELTDANFEEAALKSPLPVLVDFWTVGCAPCRATAPHVDALATAYAGTVRVAKCDMDENHQVATRLDIRAVPTFVVFKEGKVIGQIVGAAPRAKLEELLRRALV